MPRGDAQRQRFHLGGGDLFGEADQEDPHADAVDRLARNALLLDRHGEVKAEFQEQLEEDVPLGPVGLQMLGVLLEGCREVVAVGVPARMLLEASLKTRNPRSPANMGLSSRTSSQPDAAAL